jgi:L-seryl-tRNA(Ser) seleniumtransferase
MSRAWLRGLPSVERLLGEGEHLVGVYGRGLVLEGVRTAVAQTRHAILNDSQTEPPTIPYLLAQTETYIANLLAPSLRPVINATGVIIHTNLGRAPLSVAAQEAIVAVAGGYSTLEYDVAEGKRGSRTVHAEQLLPRLTGAEAALVVNNNAAAVMLMLQGLCAGREVIISRGQLIEIGGGFRVPEIMAQAGVKLVEVGTTNRTHGRDYLSAITPNSAAILVAHPSNYKIIGFTSEPELSELAQIAHAHNLLLLYDQGSGALRDTAVYGLDPEPTVQAGISAGCDVVCFSGDKLLGGPQAGILCGRAEVLAHLKKAPLMRAIRPDKLCLAGLTATLTHYLRDEVEAEIPVWWMMSQTVASLGQRAHAWAALLQGMGLEVGVMGGNTAVGGGSLPGTTLPTHLLTLRHPQLTQIEQRLRQQPIPIIARIQDDQLLFDPRTILPHQEPALLQGIQQALAQIA